MSDELTPREKTALLLRVCGFSYKETAAQMCIKESTVRQYLYHAHDKTRASGVQTVGAKEGTVYMVRAAAASQK